MADAAPTIWERLFGRQQQVQKDWSALNEAQQADAGARAAETFSRLFGPVYSEEHGQGVQGRAEVGVPGTADFGMDAEKFKGGLLYGPLRAIEDKKKMADIDQFLPPIKPGENVVGLDAMSLAKRGYGGDEAFELEKREASRKYDLEPDIPLEQKKQEWALGDKLQAIQTKKWLSSLSLVDLMNLYGRVDPDGVRDIPRNLQYTITAWSASPHMRSAVERLQTPDGLREFIAESLSRRVIPMISIGAKGV